MGKSKRGGYDISTTNGTLVLRPIQEEKKDALHHIKNVGTHITNLAKQITSGVTGLLTPTKEEVSTLTGGKRKRKSRTQKRKSHTQKRKSRKHNKTRKHKGGYCRCARGCPRCPRRRCCDCPR